jgi:hypothetical protein
MGDVLPEIGKNYAVYDLTRGSPIGGDAPGPEQRCSADVSTADLANAESGRLPEER